MLLYMYVPVSLSICQPGPGEPRNPGNMWINGRERNWTHVAIVDCWRQL